jgi:hypothetical protein
MTPGVDTHSCFLRVAANWSFIAMAQRTNSTASASGSLGLEPRLPPARDHAESSSYRARLSAWELACQVSVTSAPQVSGHLRLSVSSRRVPVLTPPSGTQRAHCRGMAIWMQTMGACQVGTTTAASGCCLRSCMRAVVRPCCYTSCCTDLTLTRQGNSVRLPPAMPALLALASSSRSQRAMRSTTTLILSGLRHAAVGVLWRPLVSAAVVTHIVTHRLGRRRPAFLSGARRGSRADRNPHHRGHRRAAARRRRPGKERWCQALRLLRRLLGY